MDITCDSTRLSSCSSSLHETHPAQEDVWDGVVEAKVGLGHEVQADGDLQEKRI